MIWIGLAAWCLAIVLSVVAHEMGHVVVGRWYGWTYRGLIVKPVLFAVGVDLEANGNGRHLWKIALGGPVATALCFAAFWGLGHTPGMAGMLARSLAQFNLALLAVNVAPLIITDGGQIVRELLRGT